MLHDLRNALAVLSVIALFFVTLGIVYTHQPPVGPRLTANARAQEMLPSVPTQTSPQGVPVPVPGSIVRSPSGQQVRLGRSTVIGVSPPGFVVCPNGVPGRTDANGVIEESDLQAAISCRDGSRPYGPQCQSQGWVQEMCTPDGRTMLYEIGPSTADVLNGKGRVTYSSTRP
jgi:hypothetical protein